MHPILKEIFEKKEIKDRENNTYPLHSHTNAEQCAFIQELILEAKPSKTLEIGLAYGISTIAILDALSELKTPFHHIVIDPFQRDAWKDIGLLNIEKGGFLDNVTFYSRFSDQVLPALYSENARIQFAYIDSTKVFDILMTDVYFITKIMDINGMLVLDDCGFPGIRTLVRFLSQHPSYVIHKSFSKDPISAKVNLLRTVYTSFLKMLPFKSRALPNYNFTRDEELGLNYNCIAFKKIKEDDRDWQWHRNF